MLRMMRSQESGVRRKRKRMIRIRQRRKILLWLDCDDEDSKAMTSMLKRLEMTLTDSCSSDSDLASLSTLIGAEGCV